MGFHDWRMVGKTWFEQSKSQPGLGWTMCRLRCERQGCGKECVTDYYDHFYGPTEEVR